MNLKTSFLCTYRATLAAVQHDTGKAHFGRRLIASVTGGEFSGGRLNGRVLAGGGDWAAIDDERDVLRLDARVTWETDDGATIFVSYQGVLKPLSLLRQHAGGGNSAAQGEFYFRTAPRFETGDPRYAWLNDVVAIGVGAVEPRAVRYELFAVE